MSTFRSDLEAGQIVENEVAQIFISKGYMVSFNTNNDLENLRG